MLATTPSATPGATHNATAVHITRITTGTTTIPRQRLTPAPSFTTAQSTTSTRRTTRSGTAPNTTDGRRKMTSCCDSRTVLDDCRNTKSGYAITAREYATFTTFWATRYSGGRCRTIQSATPNFRPVRIFTTSTRGTLQVTASATGNVRTTANH